MKRGQQTDTPTLRLLDQLGPEGQVGENNYIEGINSHTFTRLLKCHNHCGVNLSRFEHYKTNYECNWEKILVIRDNGKQVRVFIKLHWGTRTDFALEM